MPHGLFDNLAVIVSVVAVLSLVVRRLRQPPIIGYVLAGIVLSPYGLGVVHDGLGLETFSELGVSFLLFMVGLSLNPRLLKDVGPMALLVGVLQIVLATVLGTCIALRLGFPLQAALYIGVGIAFGSTIIILKLLTDTDQMHTLHARIAIGILIVQDIAAMTLLIIVPSLMATADGWHAAALHLLIRGGGFALFVIPFGTFIVPSILRFVAGSQELLLLFSIGWCLAVGAFCRFLGLSAEIGALVAGVALSVSPYRFNIAAKLTPLRDFFLVFFLVLLGSHMSFDGMTTHAAAIATLSAFVLVGNPLIVVLLLSLCGYGSKTALRVGLSLSQVSEFSLILASLGVQMGHIGGDVVSLLTIVGLVTIAVSTYFVLYADAIVRLLDRPLHILRHLPSLRSLKEADHDASCEILLVGHDRVGLSILRALRRAGYRTLVVDYDPVIVASLSAAGVDARFGDVGDAEFVHQLRLGQTKLAVCTIRDFDATAHFVRAVRSACPHALILALSERSDDALRLYELGASYVITPHVLSGEHIAVLIEQHGFDGAHFAAQRAVHLKTLHMHASWSIDQTL